MSEKKENTAAEAPEGDDNPWDDDEGARTVATGAPVDLPFDVPSPITNPPPAMPQPPPPAAVPKLGGLPPKKPGKATMIGIAGPAPGAVAPPELGKPAPPMPPAPPAPRPPAPAVPSSGGMPVIPRAGANPSSQRMPIGSPLAAKRPSAPDVPSPPSSDAYGDRQEDGPTMAVPPDAMGAQAIASMREEAKRRSPMSSTGYSPPGAKDAPIDALAFDNKPHPVAPQKPPPPPPRAPSQPEPEHDEVADETTRAVARDELLRQQQEDHVVVGDQDDAVGDEATLAVAPGQVDLGPGGGEIAAALQATLGKREDAPPAFPPPPPAFPPPPAPHGQPGSNPHMPAAQPMNASGATAAMASYRGAGLPQPPPSSQQQQQPYDPMMPNPQGFGGPMQHGGYPSSGHQPVMGPQSQNMPMSSPGTHPMMGNNMGMPMGGPMAPPNQNPNAPPPPWMTQPSPPPTGMVGGFKITPQVIMLAVVGIVCLAIFVVGIVLFVQTKF